MAAKKKVTGKKAAVKGVGTKGTGTKVLAAKPARRPAVRRKTTKALGTASVRGRALVRLATAMPPSVLATAAAAPALAQDQVIRFFNVPDRSDVRVAAQVEGTVILAAELLEDGQVIRVFTDAEVRSGAVRFTVRSPHIYSMILTTTFVTAGRVDGVATVTFPDGIIKSKSFDLEGDAGEVGQVTITIATLG